MKNLKFKYKKKNNHLNFCFCYETNLLLNIASCNYLSKARIRPLGQITRKTNHHKTKTQLNFPPPVGFMHAPTTTKSTLLSENIEDAVFTVQDLRKGCGLGCVFFLLNRFVVMRKKKYR